jgi:hypothetical protein
VTGPLRLVSRNDYFSTYARRDGSLRYLAHGELFCDVALDWDDVVVSDLWDGYLGIPHAFLDMLREVFHDGDPARCDDCLSWVVDTCTTQSGEVVCDACRDNYSRCEECEEVVHLDNINTIYDGDRYVCDSCIQRNYTWCDQCGTYHSDNEGACVDNEPCTCEAHELSFAIRNDALPPLQNDTWATVALPAGLVDEIGVQRIRSLLPESVRHTLEIDPRVQLKTGNISKRIGSAVHKATGIALTPAVRSEIGNIAAAHSTGKAYTLAVTRDLNQSACDFGNPDSCWFTSGEYGVSRCALKSNGGFGLRSFDPLTGRVTGRAWVLPLAPAGSYLDVTHDTLTPAAFVVFNGYGDLEGYAPARILAQMFGASYSKISFSCSPMYVNSNAGYLVAPEDVLQHRDALNLSVDPHDDAPIPTQDRISA